jgi:hypothetical protein
MGKNAFYYFESRAVNHSVTLPSLKSAGSNQVISLIQMQSIGQAFRTFARSGEADSEAMV